MQNPDSYADFDASNYKMYPQQFKKGILTPFKISGESDESFVKEFYGTIIDSKRAKHSVIIRKNFNTICDIKLRKKLDNLSIYYTDVALPVGLMKCVCNNEELNSIQVNIYMPNLGDEHGDANRPTFVIMQKDAETRDTYRVFDEMTRNIEKEKFNGHPDISFLFNKSIIHRSMLNLECQEMTRSAVINCINSKCGIEVDLLNIGRRVIIWRNDMKIPDEFILSKQDSKEYDEIKNILKKLPSTWNEYELDAVRAFYTKESSEYSEIMTLEELIELVQMNNLNAEIPVLLEIKENWGVPDENIRDHIIIICRILRKYKLKGYALCSSNPIVVRFVKDFDIRIPCGWITMDFRKHNKNVPEDFTEIHENATGIGGLFKGIDSNLDAYYAIPDFISCNVDDYHEESKLYNKCKEYNLPVIGWSVESAEDFAKYKNLYGFSNILKENFK